MATPYTRMQAVALLLMGGFASVVAFSLLVLWWWQRANPGASDTGDVMGLTAIMLASRALVLYLVTAAVLAVTPSLSSGWKSRSLISASMLLGLVSSCILWGWILLASRFYAPTLMPAILEVLAFGALGALQCIVLKPVRSWLV